MSEQTGRETARQRHTHRETDGRTTDGKTDGRKRDGRTDRQADGRRERETNTKTDGRERETSLLSIMFISHKKRFPRANR